MTKKVSNSEQQVKNKGRKLKLKKETLKDLNAQDSTEIRGGIGTVKTVTCPWPTYCMTCLACTTLKK